MIFRTLALSFLLTSIAHGAPTTDVFVTLQKIRCLVSKTGGQSYLEVIDGDKFQADKEILSVSDRLCLDILEATQSNVRCDVRTVLETESDLRGFKVVNFKDTEIGQGCTDSQWNGSEEALKASLDETEQVSCEAGKGIFSPQYVKIQNAQKGIVNLPTTAENCIARGRALLQERL